MDEKDTALKSCLTHEQLHALLMLEKTTHKSVASLIREGIELYLKATKTDAPGQLHDVGPAFPPIVFDQPYREWEQ